MNADSFTDLRKKMTPSRFAHSAWVGITTNGSKVSVNEQICYANLLSKTKFKKLALFFGEDYIDYETEAWASWVIRQSPFAQVFKTKTTKTGFKSGFEVDCSQSYFLVKFGMILLRQAFEHRSWDFAHYRSLGFSPLESWVLSVHYLRYEKEGKYYPAAWCSNHLVLGTKNTWQAYNLDNLSYSKQFVTPYSKYKVTYAKVERIFPEDERVQSLRKLRNREDLPMFLKELKSLQETKG